MQKIYPLNTSGEPIYKPRLKELIETNLEAVRLKFSIDTASSVDHGCLQCIAVCIPPDEDGSADLQYVLTLANNIGRHVSSAIVVVHSSAVPVGTAKQVKAITVAQLLARFGGSVQAATSSSPTSSVISSPEFRKEGAAIEDFTRADCIALGGTTESLGQQGLATMGQFYATFHRNDEPTRVLNVNIAKFSKYTARTQW